MRKTRRSIKIRNGATYIDYSVLSSISSHLGTSFEIKLLIMGEFDRQVESGFSHFPMSKWTIRPLAYHWHSPCMTYFPQVDDKPGESQRTVNLR